MQYREICDLSNDEIKDVINRVILKNSNPNEEEYHLIKNIYGIKRRKRTKDIVLKVDIEWHYIDIFMQKPVSEIETEVMILNDEEIIAEDFCFSEDENELYNKLLLMLGCHRYLKDNPYLDDFNRYNPNTPCDVGDIIYVLHIPSLWNWETREYEIDINKEIPEVYEYEVTNFSITKNKKNEIKVNITAYRTINGVICDKYIHFSPKNINIISFSNYISLDKKIAEQKCNQIIKIAKQGVISHNKLFELLKESD